MRRGAAHLAGLVLLSCATLGQAGDLPTVQVVFEFDSGMCNSKLQTRKAVVERRLSNSSMEEFRTPIEFLDWRASVPAGGDPIPRLTVRLHEEPQRSGLAFFIQYWRFVPDTAHIGRFGRIPWITDQMTRFGSKTALYAADSFERPWEDPELESLLTRRIADDLRAYRSDLDSLFLSKIPLSHELPDVDVDEQSLVLQLPWRLLHAQRSSALEVMVDGITRATLTQIQPHTAGAKHPLVCGTLTFFKAMPLLLPQGGWDAQIPALVISDRGRRIDIFMVRYEIDPDTDRNTSVPE